LKQKGVEFSNAEVAFQDLKKSHDGKVEEAKKSEDLLEALSTGLSTSDSEKGFVEQLQDAKNQSTSIASETQQAKLKLGHLNSELKELEPKAKKMEKENGDVQKTLEDTKKTIAVIEVYLHFFILCPFFVTNAAPCSCPKQKELSALKFTPEKEADLVKRKGTEEEIIAGLRAVSCFLSPDICRATFLFEI